MGAFSPLLAVLVSVARLSRLLVVWLRGSLLVSVAVRVQSSAFAGWAPGRPKVRLRFLHKTKTNKSGFVVELMSEVRAARSNAT